MRKNTDYSQVAFSRRWSSDDFGQPVWVIALEDLILAKLLWIQQLYSDRQATDIKQLLQSDEFDKAYLQLWIEKLNLKTYELDI